MFVLASAAGSALYAKALTYSEVIPDLGWKTDVPILTLLAIALSAVTLGAWKDHSAVLMMLQFTLACVGCLTLTWIVEAGWERGVRYWYQGTFAATVTLPILIRSHVKTRMPRGPRRERNKRICEAIFFSYLNILLVTVGVLLQGLVFLVGQGAAVPVPATPTTGPAPSTSYAVPPALPPDLPPDAPPPLPPPPAVVADWNEGGPAKIFPTIVPSPLPFVVTDFPVPAPVPALVPTPMP
jgi:hypothetical protein